MVKAAFLDRDGIININTGHAHKADQIIFVEGIFKLCQTLQKLNYKIVIITNQAGIAKGYYSEKQFHELMDWMTDEFQKRDIDFDGIYYCPHHKDGLGDYQKICECRKPESGMILKAASELDLDVSESLFIGDKMSDMIAATRAKVKGRILMCDTAKEEAASSDAQKLNIRPFTSHGAITQWLSQNQMEA